MVTLVAGSALAGPALAQGDPAGAPGATLSEIVVTANRRQENLQQVPIAVTAVTADTLSKSGIAQVQQLTQVTPNLVFSRNNSQFQPTIRGVGTRGTSPGDESNVSVYIDGIYQPTIYALSFDFLETDRVEVLRGPQGTLFGRNSTGGMINIITPDPKFTVQGNVEVSYARFNERKARAYVTAPLSDNVAVDVAAMYVKDDGYVRDLVRGGKIARRSSGALRSKLLFKPTEDSRIVLTGYYSDSSDNTAQSVMPLAGNTQGRLFPGTIIATEKRTAGLSLVPDVWARQYGASLQGSFRLGAVRVEGSLATQKNSAHSLTDSDASSAPLQQVSTHSRDKSHNAELRLLSDNGGRFQWIAGAFLFDNESQWDPIQIQRFNPATGARTLNSVTFTRNLTQSGAVFGEGNYALTDNLKITVGLRYTEESRKFTGFALNAAGAPLPPVGPPKLKFHQLTPRAIVQYSFSPQANIYASYSKGFKSGVFNTSGVAAANLIPVDPEKIDAYEVGLKADVTDWLRTNLAAFYYDYRNIQVSSLNPASGLSTLQNAASATIKGAEIEATAVVSPDLSLRASASVLDANYDDFLNAIVTTPLFNAQGQPIGNTQFSQSLHDVPVIRAPKFTFNLGADYSHPLGAGVFGATANLYHSAGFSWEPLNRLRQPAYTLLNGEISYTLDLGGARRLKASVFGENLLNDDYYLTIITSSLSDYGSLDKPRRVGVALRLSF